MQKEVLALYRSLMRAAKRKQGNETPETELVIRKRWVISVICCPIPVADIHLERFRDRARWSRRDVDQISAWLRNGYDHLETLQRAETQGLRIVTFRDN